MWLLVISVVLSGELLQVGAPVIGQVGTNWRQRRERVLMAVVTIPILIVTTIVVHLELLSVNGRLLRMLRRVNVVGLQELSVFAQAQRLRFVRKTHAVLLRHQILVQLALIWLLTLIHLRCLYCDELGRF